jgi:hypothetical protein
MKPSKPLLFVASVTGLLLALAPLYGILFAALSVSSTLSRAGVSDPRSVALDVGNGMMGTLIGFMVCPLGLGILLISLIFLLKKPSSVPPAVPE